MATVTWTHGGTPATVLTAAGASGSGSAVFTAPMAAWFATTNENGTTGTVNVTSDGGSPFFADISVGVHVEDAGISTSETINTISFSFDWTIVNGPMGTATARSSLVSAVDPVDDFQGPGTSSGSYARTITGDAFFGFPGSTIADFYAFYLDPTGLFPYFGLDWLPFYDSGTFSAHNRSLTVSNFTITIDYGASGPTLTSVSPAHGDKSGNTLVTLTGTGLAGATGVTFGGDAAAIQSVSDTEITCLTPSHAVGLVDVVVTVP
jgi:hypothetical protein